MPNNTENERERNKAYMLSRNSIGVQSPLEVLLQQERLNEIFRHADDRTRGMVEMHVLEGHSFLKVGRAFGVSEPTAKRVITRFLTAPQHIDLISEKDLNRCMKISLGL